MTSTSSGTLSAEHLGHWVCLPAAGPFNAESGRASNTRGIVLVGNQAGDENVLSDLLQPQGLFGGLGDDPFVGFTVDHDLPAARAHRFAAFIEGLAFIA